MKEVIQKEAVKVILADYCNALENTLYYVKKIYDKNTSSLPSPQKDIIINRMQVYFEVLKKAKHYSEIVNLYMEKNDKMEVCRYCRLILQLFQLVKDDSKDLAQYIKTGSFPKYFEKETLH